MGFFTNSFFLINKILWDISLLKIINVTPDSKILFWKVASIADTAAVNPNGIETLLANFLSTFFSKREPVYSNGSKIILENSPDCPILCNWVFDNFILADDPFAKALRSLETCVLANNNLCGKLSS